MPAKSSTTKTVQFQTALVDGHWQDQAVVEIDSNGWIKQVGLASDGMLADETYDLAALPGMVNVHSHAFQRAIAGLSEFRTTAQDSFWTWRNLMYDFLLKLTADDVYVIARQLYLEMMLAGYTWVAEFHYLHNRPDGRRYPNLAELSRSLIRAASDAGIGLCLVPVLYQRGGFDNRPLQGGQRRFELSNQQFIELFEQVNQVQRNDFATGMALHSLRTATVLAGNEVISEVLVRKPDCPVHIHVAEQIQEVEDCLKIHAQRPVEFLFENFPVNANWCLIHATHLDPGEIDLICGSGAIAGLCPTTEANLGDGLFSARTFMSMGANWRSVATVTAVLTFAKNFGRWNTASGWQRASGPC